MWVKFGVEFDLVGTGQDQKQDGIRRFGVDGTVVHVEGCTCLGLKAQVFRTVQVRRSRWVRVGLSTVVSYL